MGRYTRIHGRNSLNYSSIIIIVVVVSACIIGTWITTSSLVGSAQNFELSVKFITDVKLQNVRKKQSGDLPANAPKLNFIHASGRDESDSKPQGTKNTLQKFEKLGELGHVEMLEKGSSDEDDRIDSNHGKKVKFRVEEDAKHVEQDSVSNNGRNESTPTDQQESEENIAAIKPKTDEGEEKSLVLESSDSTKEGIVEIKDEANSQSLGQVTVSLVPNKDAGEKTTDSWSKDLAKLLNGTSDWIVVPAAESEKEIVAEKFSLLKDQKGFRWKLCNVTAGPDYIPCLDNIRAIRKLPSTSHSREALPRRSSHLSCSSP